MEVETVNSFNHVSSSTYLVYNDGVKIVESDNFNDIKDYLYKENCEN